MIRQLFAVLDRFTWIWSLWIYFHWTWWVHSM